MQLTTRFAFILISIVWIASACNKVKNEGPLIFVTPEDVTLYAEKNSVIDFAVTMSSSANIEKLTIKSRRENSTETLVEKEYVYGNTKNRSETFYYRVPADMDENEFVSLTFELMDVNGEVAIMPRKVIAKVTEKPLTEYSGLNMYTHLAVKSKPDAFNLEKVTNKFSNLSAITDWQFMDDSTAYKAASDTSLSKAWIGSTNVTFRKDNNFDYSKATNKNVKSAFEAGLSLNKITSITKDDIILVRYELDKVSNYAVIRITNVEDLVGIDGDRYSFSIKK